MTSGRIVCRRTTLTMSTAPPTASAAIEKPDVSSVAADPAGSPLANVPALTVLRQAQLGLPLNGPVTDLAYDPSTDRFLVTTTNGVYITDGAFNRVLRHTVVDVGFSVDLARFTAGAFLWTMLH